jgi:hypothetical protein
MMGKITQVVFGMGILLFGKNGKIPQGAEGTPPWTRDPTLLLLLEKGLATNCMYRKP